jgi:hypothetical protein
MTSQITASVSFDFKGISHNLKANIDFNSLVNIESAHLLDFIYTKIATQNNIDKYSYELEMLMNEEIIFSNPIGYIKQCFINKKLDLNLIKPIYEANIINDIIKKYNLNDTKSLRNALLEAYNKR